MEQFLNRFKRLHTYDDIILWIKQISKLDILIIGDTIIDEYQYGTTLGKSGKSPIVAFRENHTEAYDGGILAIGNHLDDFCNIEFLTDKQAIRKKRFIDNNQKIFETYSYEENKRYPSTRETKAIQHHDIVLVADFGHGYIKKELKQDIEKESKYIALNTQFNAGNMGFNTINKYSRYDYVCIDHNELRLATSNQYDSIENIIFDRFKDSKVTVSITDSYKGTHVFKDNKLVTVPAFAKDIVDTVGAGDAYLAITSPLAYLNAPIDVIGFIGNVAGAIACSYPGNKEHVTKQRIFDFIKEIYVK